MTATGDHRGHALLDFLRGFTTRCAKTECCSSVDAKVRYTI